MEAANGKVESAVPDDLPKNMATHRGLSYCLLEDSQPELNSHSQKG